MAELTPAQAAALFVASSKLSDAENHLWIVATENFSTIKAKNGAPSGHDFIVNIADSLIPAEVANIKNGADGRPEVGSLNDPKLGFWKDQRVVDFLKENPKAEDGLKQYAQQYAEIARNTAALDKTSQSAGIKPANRLSAAIIDTVDSDYSEKNPNAMKGKNFNATLVAASELEKLSPGTMTKIAIARIEGDGQSRSLSGARSEPYQQGAVNGRVSSEEARLFINNIQNELDVLRTTAALEKGGTALTEDQQKRAQQARSTLAKFEVTGDGAFGKDDVMFYEQALGGALDKRQLRKLADEFKGQNFPVTQVGDANATKAPNPTAGAEKSTKMAL